MTIRIVGPRDKRVKGAINTAARSGWMADLSPFRLGPATLYGKYTARIFENAWQFSKLYKQFADANGDPTADYWRWAERGWNDNQPRRYPMGKGAKPLCALWDGQRLGYVEARRRIYFPIYRDLVRNTNGFKRLEDVYRADGSVTLFDFDGYDYLALGRTLNEVLNDPNRICGHSFILAMMLTFGSDVSPLDVDRSAPSNAA